MGHHNRRFVGDVHANSGFWGTPTSMANFCEEDYAVTRYAAEFINTISNLAYVYYALRFLYYAGTGSSNKQGAAPPWRCFDSLAFALILVGVTSAAYHATLRQGPQFSDDLSMLLLAGCLLQRLYTEGQTPAAASLVTVAAMVHLIWPRTLYIIYYGKGGARPAPEKAKLARRFWKAVALLVGAFVI
ncbi:ceramidase-domain-containing protein [Xylariales sp. PMI_506]|nr:ceramidase-domain-containing protein [Xylariales sp. PMI_506]